MTKKQKLELFNKNSSYINDQVKNHYRLSVFDEMAEMLDLKVDEVEEFYIKQTYILHKVKF